MGIVFVFQAEYHLSITAISILSHSLDSQSNFCLLVAAGRRNLTPVWLAGYFPFALGVNHQFLLMLRAQGAGYRWTANELMVSCDSLEVAPAWCCLILGNGRFRYFESEVILGYAIESSALNMGRHRSFTYNGIYTIAFIECALANSLHRFWKDDAFQHFTIAKCVFSNALYFLWNVKNSHQSPIVCKCIATDMGKGRW